MRITIAVGILLILPEITSLAYQGIPNAREKRIGGLCPIRATEETQERSPLPLVAGEKRRPG